VRDALRKQGIRHALVDTGEIGTLGGKADEAPWSVGIQHPRRPDAYVALAKLRGRCLATSGDYASSFSPDHAQNHLFDPRTGRSPGELASVSVAARTATEADAVSTAVFVLGVGRGLKLIHDTREADALLVLKDGRTLATAGFPQVA
jgi:thiamine biosynthesis lipoprotein